VLNQRTPKRVLDLGSGTGVLAIAAAKALRRRVLATDIDFRSVIVARENAHLNGVGTLVEAVHATGFHAPDFAANGPFGLVMANILANPLRRPRAGHGPASGAASLRHPVGVAATSGEQRGGGLSRRGLKLLKRIQIDGWSSLLMQRR
jgi:ribosomal protein L11 methyltransferase